jgi:plastocyanin
MPGGHTVVADDGSFSSPPLAKDQTWSHTFEKAGSFGVHIKEHPGAKAKIEVR